MKKLLLAGLGLATMTLTAPTSAGADGPPNRASPFAWTGFYAGVHAGYAFSSKSASLSGDTDLGTFLIGDEVPRSLPADLNGFLGGLQVGRNWQFGTIVVGIEADISHLGINGSAAEQRPFALGPAVLETKLQSEIDWLSTVRGRAGVLPTGNLLIFASGGLAFGHVEQRLTFANTGTDDAGFIGAVDAGLSCPPASQCLTGSSSKISVGWTAGAGLEYALTPRVSLKGEYLFVGLGEHLVIAKGPPDLATPDVFLKATTNLDLHIVRAGINVKF